MTKLELHTVMSSAMVDRRRDDLIVVVGATVVPNKGPSDPHRVGDPSSHDERIDPVYPAPNLPGSIGSGVPVAGKVAVSEPRSFAPQSPAANAESGVLGSQIANLLLKDGGSRLGPLALLVVLVPAGELLRVPLRLVRARRAQLVDLPGDTVSSELDFDQRVVECLEVRPAVPLWPDARRLGPH
jgi:hypothetical protein